MQRVLASQACAPAPRLGASPGHASPATPAHAAGAQAVRRHGSADRAIQPAAQGVGAAASVQQRFGGGALQRARGEGRAPRSPECRIWAGGAGGAELHGPDASAKAHCTLRSTGFGHICIGRLQRAGRRAQFAVFSAAPADVASCHCPCIPAPCLASLPAARPACLCWPQHGGGAAGLRPRGACLVRPAPPAARVAQLHRLHPAAWNDAGGGGKATGMADRWVPFLVGREAGLPAGVTAMPAGQEAHMPSRPCCRQRCASGPAMLGTGSGSRHALVAVQRAAPPTPTSWGLCTTRVACTPPSRERRSQLPDGAAAGAVMGAPRGLCAGRLAFLVGRGTERVHPLQVGRCHPAFACTAPSLRACVAEGSAWPRSQHAAEHCWALPSGKQAPAALQHGFMRPACAG